MAKSEKVAARAQHSTQAQQSRDEIEGFYKLGSRVLKRASKYGLSVSAAARDVVDSEGGSLDTAQRAAQFCKPYPTELPEWLYALCELPGRKRLSVGHVRSVLKIKKGSDRKNWLVRAVNEGWTPLELQRSIMTASDNEPSHGGGRRIKAPTDLVGTLDQVIKLTEDWLKRYHSAWGLDKSWPPTIGYGQVEPEVLLKRIEEALEQVTLLKHGCESLEARLKKAKRQLKRSSGPA